MKFKGIIYRAENIITSQSYVGRTNNFRKRKRIHISEALKGSNKHPKFYNAIRKYGPENFRWSIIDWSFNADTLKICEIYWIAKLETLSPGGYNLTLGGENGFPVIPWNKGKKTGPLSEELKRKMSLARKGEKHWNYGKTTPKESRIKMSKSHRGQKPWNKGKTLSEEYRMKIRKTLLGSKRSEESKAKQRQTNLIKRLRRRNDIRQETRR